MEFISVDIKNNLGLCVDFRRDAHLVSYGCDKDFDEGSLIKWFEHLAANNPLGFRHIVQNGKIIGQIEFKTNIVGDDGVKRGYINLLYLASAYRGLGYGEKIQRYILNIFMHDGCEEAHLRYIPDNKVAGAFYTKHQWKPVGENADRGQLMVKKLF